MLHLLSKEVETNESQYQTFKAGFGINEDYCDRFEQSLIYKLGGALKTMSKNFSSLILMKLCDHVGIWFIRVCFKFGLKIPSGSA